MKPTGIVRRIDDLGRVVIPKEILRTMKLQEGDPMEIFINDDAVCFRKYVSSINIENEIRRLASLIGDDYDMEKGLRDSILFKLNAIIESFNKRR